MAMGLLLRKVFIHVSTGAITSTEEAVYTLFLKCKGILTEMYLKGYIQPNLEQRHTDDLYVRKENKYI